MPVHADAHATTATATATTAHADDDRADYCMPMPMTADADAGAISPRLSADCDADQRPHYAHADAIVTPITADHADAPMRRRRRLRRPCDDDHADAVMTATSLLMTAIRPRRPVMMIGRRSRSLCRFMMHCCYYGTAPYALLLTAAHAI